MNTLHTIEYDCCRLGAICSPPELTCLSILCSGSSLSVSAQAWSLSWCIFCSTFLKSSALGQVSLICPELRLRSLMSFSSGKLWKGCLALGNTKVKKSYTNCWARLFSDPAQGGTVAHKTVNGTNLHYLQWSGSCQQRKRGYIWSWLMHLQISWFVK